MEPKQKQQRYYTKEEYFALEEKAEYKSEYRHGEIIAMAGGSARHNLIAANMVRRILEGLDSRDCIGYGSDMKIDIATANTYVYADALVVCAPQLFAENRNDLIKNPTLIVEVLSPSTEAYDRGEKFRLYRLLSSFSEYVLISQKEALVEVFNKQDDKTWLYQVYQGLETVVNLATLDRPIPLSEIYQKVNFDEPA